MKSNKHGLSSPKTLNDEYKPSLKIRKIGIVSRDYRIKFPNGYRDFSHSLADVVRRLDSEGCDAVLFSLFSITPRPDFSVVDELNDLKNIKSVFIEEFKGVRKRKSGRFVVYYRNDIEWVQYEFFQVFGSLTGMSFSDISDFVNLELNKRIMGNCCVLICGETNGVKYSKFDRNIHDDFGLRSAITSDVTIILNPIHDRMTRFEMDLKRKYLSENNRFVISVWNKGKEDKIGATRDGSKPAWRAYHDGEEAAIREIVNDFGVDIGVFEAK